MSPARASSEILADRLRIVLALTETNAAHRLNQSRLGGVEFEIMTLEDQAPTPADPSSDDTTRHGALAEAQARAAAAHGALEVSAARLLALEAELDALDAELASPQS